jgi:pyridoxamine 5'-phosphate oxidase
MTDLSPVRKEYGITHLSRHQLAADPLQQFDRWYQAAASYISEANAMVLATSRANRPSQRLLLLKSYDADGFVFFTHYQSQKAIDIQQNPQGALLFWWQAQEQQVRIEGRIKPVDSATSDEYFASRDRQAQLSAVASPQSQAIANREILVEKIQALQEKYPPGTAIPRPEHWGGYCVVPDYYEFWQGRANRLHDRFGYQRQDNGWALQRLAP